ncbi:MAG: hypothetical protein QOJ29_3230 [Thermoleophilaceae bacterium]|nr:hypothetical protein [Thermoleophilaceae bacterium]
MGSRASRCLLAAIMVVLAIFPAAASAVSLDDPFNQWLPDSDAASWTYAWTDSQYAGTPTKEEFTVVGRSGSSFRLGWSTDGLGNSDGTQTSNGTIDYKRTTSGLVVTNWSASAPPSQFPVLCANAAQCANSVASTHFMLIWGTRSPVLAEPLVEGTAWSTLGGANNEVSSLNRYIGIEKVKIPAFPEGVFAAKVQSTLTQAGALGDPYGSGVRTVWWVWGVGPVRITFRHQGGSVEESDLVTTNLVPRSAPSASNFLPMKAGTSQDFRWRNSSHMKHWSTERFTVAQVVNNTGRIDVKNVSGPIKISGSYVLSSRLDGLTGVSASTKAATKATFPNLGPRSKPKSQRRHFFTPFDLMTFGLNPILPAYPVKDQKWASNRTSPEFLAYAVTGHSQVIGFRRIKVPAGTYNALGVASTLSQKGFRFGSGRRETWFAPNKGLVKLVFHHRDGSVSTAERVR